MDITATPEAPSRHGKLSEDNSVISFVAPKVLKGRIKALARKDNRTPSDWIRLCLTAVVERAEAAARKPAKTRPVS